MAMARLLPHALGKDRSSPRHALIGKTAVARAIGHPIDRRVATEAKVLMAWRVDRPAAALLAQFEQSTAKPVVDRFFLNGLSWSGEYRFQDLILLPRRAFPA